MIERAIAASLEPLVDQLFDLEKRLDSVQLKHGVDGAPGKDAEPVDVEAIVKAVSERSEPVDVEALRLAAQVGLAKSFTGYRRLGKRERNAV